MKIFIIGVGRVGLKIAETYSADGNHDICLFDIDKEALNNAASRLDVFCVHDNGTNASALVENDIENAHLFLAVTHDDDVNFFACSLAKKLNSKIKTVCLGSLKSDGLEDHLSLKSLGVDHLFIPEVECANAICKLINQPHFKEIVSLVSDENLMVDTVGIKLPPGNALIGKTVEEIYQLDFMKGLEFVFFWRKGKLFSVNLKMRINNYDEVYIVGERKKIDKLLDLLVLEKPELKKVILVGFESVTLQLINQLQDEKNYKLELVDYNGHEVNSKKIFKKEDLSIPVISAEFTQEVANDIDLNDETVVISCLDDKGTNILVALLAKKTGAKRSFVIIKDFDYREIIASMDAIDSCFNPYIASLNAIFSLNQTIPHRKDFFIPKNISRSL